MMRDKPIPYGRQNITEADIAAVVETLKSDFLTQGPKIEEFERSFAEYVGAPYALSLIHLSEPTRLSRISYAVFCLKINEHNYRNGT